MGAVVLEAENRAPRVPDKVHTVVAEVRTQRIELLYEVGNRDLRGVRQTVRLPTAKLVVPNHGPFVSECLERFQVEAAEAGTAVEQDHRCRGSSSRDLIPDSPAVDGETRLAIRKRGICGRGW